MLLSVAAWLTWALGAYLVARSVGIELTMLQAIFVTAALNLGVAIPSSPGFVGTYQWLGVSALALFGIPQESALAYAIVLQAVWYVPTTLVGLGCWAPRGPLARPGTAAAPASSPLSSSGSPEPRSRTSTQVWFGTPLSVDVALRAPS